MSDEGEFAIIRENARRKPDAEKIMFYELKKKKTFVGLLLALLLFGGAGHIYAGKIARGIAFVVPIMAALFAVFRLDGVSQIRTGNLESYLIFIPLSLMLILYIYAMWDVTKVIEEYNQKLHIAVFGEYGV